MGKMVWEYGGNNNKTLKIMTHGTAMEFGMSDLQCDVWTGVFSIATCLCQPKERVYSCLELTDIKV